MTDERQEATQRVFDEALKHIRAQGQPSTVSPESSECMYRNPEGLGCAFAPAIETIMPDMEKKRASVVMSQWPECLHKWAKPAIASICDDIQNCHDEAAVAGTPQEFMDKFEYAMSCVAEANDLYYHES